MKKRTVFFALIFSLTLISGCTSKPSESSDSSSANETVTSSEKVEEKASITLVDGDKELSKKQVSFEKGESLFDVLKETYAVEDDNGMITSIDGHAQDEKNNKYWVFTINDEQVNSGAKDVTLKKDDRVVFKLEQF
ncbi:DUF4430 domain-containing protein [Enterococcus gilvus]|uniref:DUF4430 domain-containing protein n=1 Tax=Enterococcus gilvus TaxID=160453 RepID=UPI0029138839|nr:DUF4430 domain-containing protein [Enterococcus gilvus]MDU5509201.1 DUF4430 domain-containing protein [Enterococcus gilvus]